MTRVPNKIYNFTSPDGVSYTIQNLRVFCEEMNLNYPHMTQVHLENKHSYKGWRKGANQGKYPKTLRRPYNKYRSCEMPVTAPNGDNYTITNLPSFCEQHDLNIHHMRLLLDDHDDVFQHKGWRLGHDMGVYENIVKLPDETIERIIKLAEKCTVTQIATRLEIHHTTVVKYLKKYNVHVPKNRRPTKLDEDQINRVRQLVKTCTIEQVAARFSVTKNTIRNYVK